MSSLMNMKQLRGIKSDMAPNEKLISVVNQESGPNEGSLGPTANIKNNKSQHVKKRQSKLDTLLRKKTSFTSRAKSVSLSPRSIYHQGNAPKWVKLLVEMNISNIDMEFQKKYFHYVQHFADLTDEHIRQDRIEREKSPTSLSPRTFRYQNTNQDKN